MNTQTLAAGGGRFERGVRRLAEWWRAKRTARYWTTEKQLNHLRTLLLADHRWLAADKTADALTERYLAALAPDWYTRQHEDVGQLRSRLGLVPPQGYDPGPGRFEAAADVLREVLAYGDACKAGDEAAQMDRFQRVKVAAKQYALARERDRYERCALHVLNEIERWTGCKDHEKQDLRRRLVEALPGA